MGILWFCFFAVLAVVTAADFPVCSDDYAGNLAAAGASCGLVSGMLTCEGDLNTLNPEAPVGSLVKFVCCETCNSCAEASSAYSGTELECAFSGSPDSSPSSPALNDGTPTASTSTSAPVTNSNEYPSRYPADTAQTYLDMYENFHTKYLTNPTYIDYMETFDADDPGGYIMDGFRVDLDDFVQNPGFPGFSFWGNTKMAYKMIWNNVGFAGYNKMNIPALYNCTNDYPNEIIVPSDFFGKYHAKQYCNPGECCSRYIGLHMWGPQEYDIFHEEWTTRYNSAFCTESLDEESYCILIVRFAQMCMERYLSPSDRSNMLWPCPDGLYLFHLSCAVYSQGGVVGFMGPFDSELYWDTVTPAESIFTFATFFALDKVCHPYAYFNPDFAGNGDAQSGVNDNFLSF